MVILHREDKDTIKRLNMRLDEFIKVPGEIDKCGNSYQLSRINIIKTFHFKRSGGL